MPFVPLEKSVQDVADESYAYLYPLVLMEFTRRYTTTTTRGPEAHMNRFIHRRQLPEAGYEGVVGTNHDTLYSSCHLDVSNGPYLLSIPSISDRFFTFPILDMWTDVLGAPGSRTVGSSPTNIAICTPQWQGELPQGFERFNVSTPVVWIVGRIESRGRSDFDKIVALQDQILLRPLDPLNSPENTRGAVEELNIQIAPPAHTEALSGAAFFEFASELLKKHPVHSTDWDMVARLRQLGLIVGKSFDASMQTQEVQDALEESKATFLPKIIEHAGSYGKITNGWRIGSGSPPFGNEYFNRAVAAKFGLAGNGHKVSIHPRLLVDENREALIGSKNYLIRFEANALPPANAFWSLTLYNQRGYIEPNVLERYAIGDRDDLQFEDDGSLEFYVSKDQPTNSRYLKNWIPSIEQSFYVVLRLYLPDNNVALGKWKPPLVRVVE
jgi:hypothetical protein